MVLVYVLGPVVVPFLGLSCCCAAASHKVEKPRANSAFKLKTGIKTAFLVKCFRESVFFFSSGDISQPTALVKCFSQVLKQATAQRRPLRVFSYRLVTLNSGSSAVLVILDLPGS